MPMERAAPRERSMERPLIKGPRSLIRTSTQPWKHTRTMVPNGRVRLAAVSPSGWNASPLAVRRPWSYQEARSACASGARAQRISAARINARIVHPWIDGKGKTRLYSGPEDAPMNPTFADLSEAPPAELLPPLDQPSLDDQRLTPLQREWRETGVVILPRFLPDDLMDAYVREREPFGWRGWDSPTSYLDHPALRTIALFPPLMAKLQELIGEPMMLHLCLTGWISTERNWHQDDYLNPPHVNSWYAAVWMALDNIHPDSGPFEYIPGSHRWPLLRGDKVRALMPREEAESGHWPKTSERLVVPAVEAEIKARSAASKKFMAKRGDVLIWHGRLLHRGSEPNVPRMERKAVICHYSGITHRADMPFRRRDENGQRYVIFGRRSFRERLLGVWHQLAG